MRQDAFTGGVDPGGLWNQNDIRILLCYILSSVNAPLSGQDLSEILQRKALANYFEAGDALAALEQRGNVVRDEDGCYRVTEAGREIAETLDATLPLSVRDKALEAAFTLLADARSHRENRVEVAPLETGFQVTCHISGGEGMELMSISLFVPDSAQAELVKECFYRDPEQVYKLLLSSLTGDTAYARSLLEDRGE